ncbi:hypothetical protein [Pseudomonas serbica]|jgi:hypothetical protein
MFESALGARHSSSTESGVQGPKQGEDTLRNFFEIKGLQAPGNEYIIHAIESTDG